MSELANTKNCYFECYILLEIQTVLLNLYSFVFEYSTITGYLYSARQYLSTIYCFENNKNFTLKTKKTINTPLN